MGYDYLIGAIAGVIVATLVVAFLIVRMALKFEEKRLAAKSGVGERVEQILAETQADVARLRERVQVLERLATDDDRRVASEINRLRDSPAIGG